MYNMYIYGLNLCSAMSSFILCSTSARISEVACLITK